MNTLLEAFKELNESFPGAEAHYNWNPQVQTNVYSKDGINPSEAHGHVASNMMKLQKAFEMHYGFPLYFNLSLEQYEKEAEDLARASTSNNTWESTHTGIESFVGTKDLTWGSDFIYKIRFRSKLLNKNFFEKAFGDNSQLANMVWNMYVANYGTDQFSDVVIYKNNKDAKTDPEIVTFYPATLDNVERLIERCRQYDDSGSVIDENDLSAKLVIIDSLSRGYGRGKVPGYSELKCLIAAPTKISTSNKKRDNGIDNYVAYEKGVLYDPVTDKLYPFDVEELQHWKDNTSLSSKTPAKAREAFRKAALKVYADIRGKTFRSDSTDRAPYFWATSFNDAKNILNNSQEIKDKFNSWGLDDMEDYPRYDSNIQSIGRVLLRNWDKVK